MSILCKFTEIRNLVYVKLLIQLVNKSITTFKFVYTNIPKHFFLENISSRSTIKTNQIYKCRLESLSSIKFT